MNAAICSLAAEAAIDIHVTVERHKSDEIKSINSDQEERMN